MQVLLYISELIERYHSYVFTSLARPFVPFRLAPRGYSVAALPWASHSHLALLARGTTRSLRSLGLCARKHFALCAHKNFFEKKCVSIDINCYETHRNAKKKNYPFDTIRVAPSPRGEAQPYLPQVTPMKYQCQVSCRLDQNCGR